MTTAGDGGRYQFHELIATGGMGEVWQATDTALHREVAIKLLKPEYADDVVSRQRFDSEARHAAALHHPHVAAVYDVGEMPTASGLMRPYLVMELVDGKPLSDLIHTPTGARPLDPDVVRDLLGQAGDALSAAHRAGIVHRDVKPANLLVTPDRQVKVTDFGIARAASSGAVTTTGQVMGTPQYLSPEQARGEQATPASDVYSLGVVAFECLTGVRPFEKESPVATAIAHLHDPVPPLPDTVPADLAAVVMRALSKDPAERYPDAAAFTAALRGLDGGRTNTPAAGTMIPPLAAADETQSLPRTTVVGRPAAVPLAEEPAAATERRRWWQFSPLTWVLLALLLLAILALAYVGWFVTHNTSPTADTTPPTPSPTATHGHHHHQPQAVNLPADCYAGQQVNAVINQLHDANLRTTTAQVPNPGGKPYQSVQYVTPCRDVHQGQQITVKYFGPESPSPSPTTTSPTPAPTTTSPAPTTTAPTASPTATGTSGALAIPTTGVSDTGAAGEDTTQ